MNALRPIPEIAVPVGTNSYPARTLVPDPALYCRLAIQRVYERRMQALQDYRRFAENRVSSSSSFSSSSPSSITTCPATPVLERVSEATRTLSPQRGSHGSVEEDTELLLEPSLGPLEQSEPSDLNGARRNFLPFPSAVPPSDPEALPTDPLTQSLEGALGNRSPNPESDDETIADDDLPLATLAVLSKKRKYLAEVTTPEFRKRLCILSPEESADIDERIAFFGKLLLPLRDQYREKDCPWRQTILLKLMCEYSDGPLLDDQKLNALIGVVKKIRMRKYDQFSLIRRCKREGIMLRFKEKRIEARSSQLSLNVLESQSFRFAENEEREKRMHSYLARLKADPTINDFLMARDECLAEAQGIKKAGKRKSFPAEDCASDSEE